MHPIFFIQIKHHFSTSTLFHGIIIY
jgi:hypothetical protein